jgi:hypothetical protein
LRWLSFIVRVLELATPLSVFLIVASAGFQPPFIDLNQRQRAFMRYKILARSDKTGVTVSAAFIRKAGNPAGFQSASDVPSE